MDHVPPDAPRPRMCHMMKRPDFDGYGFNLHAEKRKPGQLIGVVDEGSPAEACGMKEGDRIVEVNGENISQENHKQVVQRIKSIPNETRLLVVDRETEEWYRKASIVVKGSLPSVLHMYSFCAEEEDETSPSIAECPDPEPDVNFPPLPTGSPPPLDEEAGDVSSLASSADKGTTRSAVNNEDGKKEEEEEELPPPPYPGELTEKKAEQNEIEVGDELLCEDQVGSFQNGEEILDAQNGNVGTDEKNVVLESHQEAKVTAEGEEPEVDKVAEGEEEPTYPSFVAHRVTNSDQNEKSDDDAHPGHEQEKDEADKNHEVCSEPTLTQAVVESPVPSQIVDAEDAEITAEDAHSDPEETKDVPETEVKMADDNQQQDDGKSASVQVVGAASPIPSEKSITVSDPGSSPRSFSPSQEIPDAPEIVQSRKAAKWGGLDLNMTAREMRERIHSKKKRDPRRDEGLDMRKKYEIIQTL